MGLVLPLRRLSADFLRSSWPLVRLRLIKGLELMRLAWTRQVQPPRLVRNPGSFNAPGHLAHGRGGDMSEAR